MSDVEKMYKTIFQQVMAPTPPSAIAPPMPGGVASVGVKGMRAREMSPDELRRDQILQTQKFRQNLTGLVNSGEIDTLIASYSPEEIVSINENIAGIKAKLQGKSNLDAKFFRGFVADYLRSVALPLQTLPA